jgi:hypothetical protein
MTPTPGGWLDVDPGGSGRAAPWSHRLSRAHRRKIVEGSLPNRRGSTLSATVAAPADVVTQSYTRVLELVQVGHARGGEELHRQLIASVGAQWSDLQSARSLAYDLLSHAIRRNDAMQSEYDAVVRQGEQPDDDRRARALYAGLAFVSSRALDERLRLAMLRA